jgi:hypothetical protein
MQQTKIVILEINIAVTTKLRKYTGILISVVDPKLFFSDPDPIFVRVLDPDSDPL